MNDKELELKIKIKVKSGTADAAALNMQKILASKPSVRLGPLGSPGLEVTSIKRADGQPLGLMTKFEEYWRETHVEDDNLIAVFVDGEVWDYTKSCAWGAFQAAYDIYEKDS